MFAFEKSIPGKFNKLFIFPIDFIPTSDWEIYKKLILFLFMKLIVLDKLLKSIFIKLALFEE